MTFPSPVSRASTLLELLEERAARHAERRLFSFLEDAEGESSEFSYSGLLQRALALGAFLQQEVPAGERAVLLYPPGLDYVTGFFGCMAAGVVAVPAYPPDPSRLERTLPRLRSLIHDAQASVVLAPSFITSMAEFLFESAPDLRSLRWVATDELPSGAESHWKRPELRGDSLAFLQYTSGSTGTPKGVMLSHGNLLHNLHLIHGAFRMHEGSAGVIWLPPYHDMGLIGGILGTVYGGFSTSLMSPLSFLRRPLRWLEEVSRTRGTISGGPNFAFDLCVRKSTEAERQALDLSHWEVAFCGAEPIRAETLERFAQAFSVSGFRRESFYPCYGLAEGTLIVAGGQVGTLPEQQALDVERLREGRAVAVEPRQARGQVLVGCGRALEQEVLVVHPETFARCSRGEVGEVWVKGPSIAQGYWRRAEDTQRDFHAHTADGSGPFLRTGDLGFLREDGQLFVTGRLKDLLIIRGRNHHPQDVELTAERASSALRPGCGAAFSVEVEGEEQLVLVYERDTRRQPEERLEEVVQALRQRIAEQHELRLHALTLIAPGSLPKTSSGKIQRRAARAAFLAGELQEVAAWREQGSEVTQAPRAQSVQATPEAPEARPESPEALEAWLRTRFARRLRVEPEQLDRDEPLTRYGLDSLAAVEFSHEVEKGLGLSLPMEVVLSGPSLAQLVERLSSQAPRASSAVLLPRDSASGTSAEDALPSFSQARLWFLEQLAQGKAHELIPAAVRLEGPLDTSALERGLAEVVHRHESLRTTFHSEAGEPRRVVHAELPTALRHVDLAALPAEQREAEVRRLALEESQRPFDLVHGPLLRTTLLRLSASEHVLVLVMHHIISDGSSMGVLLREMAALYEAFSQGRPSSLPALPALPVQYGDYSRWQRQWLQDDVLQQGLAFWKQQLSGAPASLELPTDKPRPSVRTQRGASQPVRLSRERWEALKALARAEGSTPFMLLQAAFQVLLSRYSGQEDFCLGTPVAGRPRPELDGLIGFFVNTLVLRARLGGNPSFRQLLRQVRETTLAAYAHQDMPFERLVEELRPSRDLSRTPLFQVMLALQPHPLDSATLPGLRLHSLELESHVARFDLELSLFESSEGLSGTLGFSTDLFEPSTASRMVGHLDVLLQAIVSRPEALLSELPLLTDSERQQVLIDFNATASPFPADACIHHLFERQVALRPDSIAVEFGDERLTYRELDARSNQLAHLLRSHGVGPDSLVALCLERSVELIVSLLGILKAGGAYLPLDASYPAQRLAFMLEDAPPRLLLTSRALRSQFPVSDALQCLLWEELSLEALPTSAPETGVTSRHLAYVDFTSGSTGRPKGVAIEHRSV
ncbi:MAG TPA: condensation domain-containing protein, partial [Archangium sp.]|uniref:condensation domain-containing protein n=1 Tax=Archangium sp. TaxID=1872627 RepID=UPI002E380AAA